MNDAREIIALTIEPFVHHADDVTSVVISALDVAGFRILGPDEVDAVALERAAEVAANWGSEIPAAIRALASGESR